MTVCEGNYIEFTFTFARKPDVFIAKNDVNYGLSYLVLLSYCLLYQLPFSGMVLNLSRNPFLAGLFCTNLLSNVMVMTFGLILEPVHWSPFISPHRLNQSDIEHLFHFKFIFVLENQKSIPQNVEKWYKIKHTNNSILDKFYSKHNLQIFQGGWSGLFSKSQ